MLKTIFIVLIRWYQHFISPLKGPSCRFFPSCSSFALEAISKYGAVRGGIMALGRLCRCHPFNPGGYDPVK